MRGITLGLTAALAVTGMAAAPASAGTGYSTAVEDISVADNSQVADEAICNPGDMAINGGTSNGTTVQQRLWLKSSYPGGFGDAWTVEVQNLVGTSTTPIPAQVWAVCDDGGQGEYKVRKKTGLPVPTENQTTQVVKCRNDEAVVGGGADVSGGIAEPAQLSSSTPLDGGDRDSRPDGWYVAAEGAGEDSPASTMDVYAVCDQERKPKKYRYVTAKADVEDDTQNFAIAMCDPDPLDPEPLVGGGVISDSKFVHALRINSTYPEGTAWTGYVDNVDTPDGKTRRITATAICLK